LLVITAELEESGGLITGYYSSTFFDLGAQEVLKSH
jgi:hypothetical protein